MDLTQLVGRWQSSGLLEGVPENKKFHMSIKLENLAKHMMTLSNHSNYYTTYGNIEMLIFPVLRKICIKPAELCGNETDEPIFYDKVNPFRVLNEFKEWWYSNNIIELRQDMANHPYIDVEAELVSIFCDVQAHNFRNDNYCDDNVDPISPIKYLGTSPLLIRWSSNKL